MPHIISSAFVFFLTIASFSGSSVTAESILLKCEYAQEPSTSSYQLWDISFDKLTITVTRFWGNGSSNQMVYRLPDFYTEEWKREGDYIQAFTEKNGQEFRVHIDRNTGHARWDFEVLEEDKHKIWDEHRNRMGLPKDEFILMGDDLNCHVTKKLF